MKFKSIEQVGLGVGLTHRFIDLLVTIHCLLYSWVNLL
jgi:hypothetical protein